MQRPKEFKTVKQPEGSRMCVACVAAMIVDKDLNYVQERMTPNFTGSCCTEPFYSMRNLFKFLLDHDVVLGVAFSNHKDKQFLYIPPKCTILELSFDIEEHPCIINTPSKNFDDASHVVLWDGKHIRDPSPDIPHIQPFDYIREVTESIVPIFYEP